MTQVALSKDAFSQTSDSGSEANSSGGSRSTSANGSRILKRKKGTPPAGQSKRQKTTSQSSSSLKDKLRAERSRRKSSSAAESSEGEEEASEVDSASSSTSSTSSKSSSPNLTRPSTHQPPPTTNGQTNGHVRNRSSSNPSSSASSPSPTSHPITYNPPPGFEQVKDKAQANDTIRKLFSPSNLSGKEVWRISAPASVPMTSITSAFRNKPKEGDVTISHAGVDYLLRPDKNTKQSLILPQDGGATYQPVTTAFARVTSLKRIIDPQDAADASTAARTGSRAAAVATIPQTKEIPRQPSGLKTRHWPAGFEENDDYAIQVRQEKQVAAQETPANGVSVLAQSLEPEEKKSGSVGKSTRMKGKEVPRGGRPTLETSLNSDMNVHDRSSNGSEVDSSSSVEDTSSESEADSEL